MSKEIWSLNTGPKEVRSFVGQQWPEPFFSFPSFLITFRRHSVADGERPWPPVSEWVFCLRMTLSQETSGLSLLFLWSSGWHMFWSWGLFGYGLHSVYVTSHTVRSLSCLYVCPKWRWGKNQGQYAMFSFLGKENISFFSHSLQPLGGICKEVISKFRWVGAFLKLIDLTYRKCLYITSALSLRKDGQILSWSRLSGVAALPWVQFHSQGLCPSPLTLRP